MISAPISNTNFKGIPIAEIKVKGINSCYKLYEINESDKDFLKKLYNSVDLKKLMPNLHEYDYINWDGILSEAINQACYKGRKTFIETCDNKPCGVINFSKSKFNTYYLNYIATFPTEPKKRVPCASQILLNQLFKTVINSNRQGIDLSALKYAPFSPISVYSGLGFKFRGGDNWTEDMAIGREGILDALYGQKKFLDVKPVENQKNIDLGNVIDLNI